MKFISVLSMIVLSFTIGQQVLAASCGDGGGNNKCLQVTCGENSYDALAEKKLIIAELGLVLQTKGPNNPPVLVSFQKDAVPVSGVQSTKYQVDSDGSISITVNMKNFDSYEITGLTNCHDIDLATGDLVVKQNKGGFAGVIPVSRAKCSCLK